MNTRTYLITAACSAMLLASCGENSEKNKETATENATPAALAPVALADVSPSPEFPGASLTVANVKAEKAGSDSTKITFNFAVKNYELMLQTSDNGTKTCNNSDKGQHIHFILDNGPYKALYEPTNEITVPNDGADHYLFAFLSRSYHESIKSEGAAVMYHFSVDKSGKLKKGDDPKTPMLIYSRPKGEYSGKDTANVLLDYYVWNCTLSADGYKVKADISNEDKASQVLNTTLVKWQPEFIQNLGTGKCKVMLTLLDKDNKPVEGTLATATREFSLKAE